MTFTDGLRGEKEMAGGKASVSSTVGGHDDDGQLRVL